VSLVDDKESNEGFHVLYAEREFERVMNSIELHWHDSVGCRLEAVDERLQ